MKENRKSKKIYVIFGSIVTIILLMLIWVRPFSVLIARNEITSISAYSYKLKEDGLGTDILEQGMLTEEQTDELYEQLNKNILLPVWENSLSSLDEDEIYYHICIDYGENNYMDINVAPDGTLKFFDDTFRYLCIRLPIFKNDIINLLQKYLGKM